jgi:hypothetical protein
MLYDSSQLARVYLHAWQVTGNEFLRTVTEEILDYVMREMTYVGAGADDQQSRPRGRARPVRTDRHCPPGVGYGAGWTAGTDRPAMILCCAERTCHPLPEGKISLLQNGGGKHPEAQVVE